MTKLKKYKLNLKDKTLYLTEESNIKYKKNYLQEDMLGSHYLIKDDIPNKGAPSLPHTELRASTFNQFPDNGKNYYPNNTQSTKWLIEIIKEFGTKI